jgi:hypothetical protein
MKIIYKLIIHILCNKIDLLYFSTTDLTVETRILTLKVLPERPFLKLKTKSYAISHTRRPGTMEK